MTEAEINELAWKLLGDPAGEGKGWIGYKRHHELVVRGIKAGLKRR